MFEWLIFCNLYLPTMRYSLMPNRFLNLFWCDSQQAAVASFACTHHAHAVYAYGFFNRADFLYVLSMQALLISTLFFSSESGKGSHSSSNNLA